MARDLSIPEEKLPFVGELVEVRAKETAWRGAIERVLGGFARSILVDEKHYSAVSAYLNERNIGERLVYFRSEEHTSELQSLMRISYAVFCLKNKQHSIRQCAGLPGNIELQHSHDCVN